MSAIFNYYVRTIVAILVTIFIIKSNLYAQQADTYKLLITSDPHTTFQLNQCNPLLYQLRKRHEGNTDHLIKFFRTIPKKTAADAVVITGDMIDFFEADISSNSTQKMANQVQQFAAISMYCPLPLYMVIGNHDIISYWVSLEDSTKRETEIYADRARASWIKYNQCFRNGTYYHEINKVGDTKYHLFFLDNGYSLHDGAKILDKTQLDWLEAELAKTTSEPVLIFMHRYYSIGDINGDGIYFKKNKPVDWPTEKECSGGLLKIINENSNIKAMFVGHQHNNVWEPIRFPAGHTVYQIMTSTLYKSPNNWRLISFTENNLIVAKPGSMDNEIIIPIK